MLKERSKRILKKEHINIDNFTSWNSANRKKIAEFQTTKLMSSEIIFFEIVCNPDNYIYKSIDIYKKFLNRRSH